VVAEVGFLELSIVSFTSYTASTMDFVPIQALARLAPNIRHIKASLRGELTEDRCFKQLYSATIPVAYELGTLKTILQFCKKLAYLETRELLTSPGLINDQDLVDMVESGCPRLEAFRLLFPTCIQLVPGIKQMMMNCPNLKIIGDLKKWNIPLSTLSRFSLNVNVHNLDVTFEHNSILYNPNTPCKELFR